MKNAIVFSLLFFLGLPSLFSESNPVLIFDGVNGYPSTGENKYKIEIYVAGNGFISEIEAYGSGRAEKTESTKIVFENNKVIGLSESKSSRTAFEFLILDKKITRHITVFDTINNTVYSDSSSIVTIAPRPGILFETDNRRFSQAGHDDLKVFDIKTNEHLYTFAKNVVINEGWYRSDWKTTGKVTTVHEYQTMEKNAEWIDAGHGVFIGKPFNRPDLIVNVVNFCILDVVYLNNPIFIPFIFGLKTGSY